MGEINHITMEKFKFYYFLVKVLHKPSPMSMVFKVNNKLKIYLSTSAIFPSKFNSEHLVYAKSVKIHAENGIIFND